MKHLLLIVVVLGLAMPAIAAEKQLEKRANQIELKKQAIDGPLSDELIRNVADKTLRHQKAKKKNAMQEKLVTICNTPECSAMIEGAEETYRGRAAGPQDPTSDVPQATVPEQKPSSSEAVNASRDQEQAAKEMKNKESLRGDIGRLGGAVGDDMGDISEPTGSQKSTAQQPEQVAREMRNEMKTRDRVARPGNPIDDMPSSYSEPTVSAKQAQPNMQKEAREMRFEKSMRSRISRPNKIDD